MKKHRSVVAQVCNLLYRRFATCERLNITRGLSEFAEALPIGNRRYSRLQTCATVQAAGFTMVEVALSLAILGFALVAIIGVLPTGLQVQKDNREDTLIHQDGQYLLGAIKSGAQGLGDLTNYVEWIRLQDTDLGGGRDLIVSNRFLDGRTIVGLLSTPKYSLGQRNRVITNRVTAKIRAISGPAVEKSPRMRDIAFNYLLISEVIPFEAYPTRLIDFNQQGISPDEALVRSNRAVHAARLGERTFEIRLTFRWPVLPDDSVGNGRQVFRSLVSAPLLRFPTNQLQLYFFTNRFRIPGS